MVSFGYKKKQCMQRPFGGSVLMETPQRNSQQFFASPPEPLFNEKHVGMKPALLEETLQQLAKENEQNMLNMDNECNGVFKNGKRAVYMFLLCKHFKLGYEEQFVAVELFSRFMSKHVAELLQHVKETKNTENAIEWSHVEQRIKHQITLRAVTCAQVASKVCSHYRIISLGSAKRFLASHGFRYAANSIVQSEVRILKTLDYKVHPPMPLTYVEALLEVLGHNDPSLTVKHLHGICLNILELYYIQRETVYTKLKQIAGVTSGQKQRGNSIEKDNMLTGSAIIGAAAYVLDKSSSDQAIEHLSKITEIVNDDILDFSAVLIEQVLTNDEE